MSGRGARSGSGASSGSGAKPICPAVSSPLSPEGRGCVPSGGDQRKSSLLMGRLYHTRVPAARIGRHGPVRLVPDATEHALGRRGRFCIDPLTGSVASRR